MKFGPLPLRETNGKILGHNVAGKDGRRALRKGRVLTADDLSLLHDLGRETIYVAQLAPDDVEENTAAHRVARAAMGTGIRLAGPVVGRANLMATTLGVLRVDTERVTRLNECPGITLATLSEHVAIQPRKMVATVKIIPFAVPIQVLKKAEQIAIERGPMIEVASLATRAVTLILSGSLAIRERIIRDFEPPLRTRLEALNASVQSVEFVTLEDESGEVRLAETITQHVAAGAELLVLAGETAIVDWDDIAPRAIARAGGQIACYGVPVDPGNLLLLGYLDSVPILGAPGCTRSKKTNVIDWVLPRLLAGDRLSAADFVALGHGGLLEENPERPQPRGRMGTTDESDSE